MRLRLISCAAALAAIAAVQLPAGAVVRKISATPSFSTRTFKNAGGEPSVSISPNGRTILVAGLNGDDPASFHRSVDGGRTFAPLTPRFSDTGGGDWDMRWLDDRTVVAVDLGAGVLVHRSEDRGASWTTTSIDMDFYDRPWLDHYGKDLVYVVAKGFDGIPYLYTSSDGGRSFGAVPIPVPIYGRGTVPAAAGGTSPNAAEMAVGSLGAYLDHMTVDPKTGDLYVLYGLAGENSFDQRNIGGISNRLYVAHLENGAMISRPVYMGGPDDGFISGFNWMTVDAAGTVYVLANGVRNGHHSAYLSYSKDRGRTWSALTNVAPKGAANVYGSIAAGSPGVLSLVYLRGSIEDPAQDQNWYVEMARITGASTARPSVYRTRPVRAPVHQKDICFDGILCGMPGFGKNRSLLDFIWNAVAPDGTAYAVVASDGPATKDDGSKTSVLLLRQTGGATHGRGAPS